MDDYDETVDITELTEPLFEALLLLKREGVLQWEGSIGEWRATLSVELDGLEDESILLVHQAGSEDEEGMVHGFQYRLTSEQVGELTRK